MCLSMSSPDAVEAATRAAARVTEILHARQELAEPVLAVIAELFRAEREHPTWGQDAAHAVGYLTEEVGELSKCVNDYNEFGGVAYMDGATGEAAQVGAVALRFLMHADSFVPARGGK